MSKTADLKITRARVGVIKDDPFWGSILLRLPMVKSDKHGPTMAVDGRNIYYNEKWVEGLDEAQLRFVLMHECGHVLMMHHLRRGNRHPMKWNYAGDYALNAMLKASPAVTMPKEGLYDKKYEGWPSEKIYNDLPEVKQIMIMIRQNPNNKGQGEKNKGEGDPDSGDGQGNGSEIMDVGGCGVVIDMTDENGKQLSASEREAAEQETRGIIAAAVQQAKSRGNLPGGLESLIKELMEPQVIWQDELRRFMSATSIPSDYSMKRPAKRYMSQGLYLPGTVKEGVGKIAFFTDTSGSVSDAELRIAASEMQAIKDEIDPESIVVVMCDAQIQWTREFVQGEDLDVTRDVKFAGRGGTSFHPPFDWIKQQGHELQCAIYLTDGEGQFPPEAPYPVLWLITTDIKAPWGKTVKMVVR
jgi:predicted metal-dependent peptidase